MADLDRSGPLMFVSISNAGAKSVPLPIDVRLMSMVFDMDEAKSDKLDLTIDNHDLANFDTPLFAIGNVVTFKYGYPGAMGPERTASITKVSGSTTLKVECKGESHVANLVPRSRTFENMRRSDVAKIICEEQGLTNAPGTFIQESPVVISHIAQVRETDQQFLRSLANKEGFDFYQNNTGFHFHARKVDASPVRQFQWFVGGAGDVESFSVEGDITAKPALIIHAGRDPLAKENFAVYANNQTLPDRPTNAPVLTISLDPTGVLDTNSNDFSSTFSNANKAAQGNAAAQAALFTAQAQLVAQSAGNDGIVDFDKSAQILRDLQANIQSSGAHLSTSTAKDADDAQAQANAGFQRAEQKALKITLNCVGDALIESKQTIQLVGFGRVLDGNYHVTNVNHKVGPGYKMTIKATRSGVGAQAGMAANLPTSDGTVNTKQGPAAANTTPVANVDPQTGVVIWTVGTPTK